MEFCPIKNGAGWFSSVFVGCFMKKQLSAIALLAGTAIGSGMLSLPLVLARYGIVFSCVMMCAFIWVAYYSSIIRTELNIYSYSSYAIKDVGLHFSGKIASQIGNVSLKLLSYSLIAAYLHGLASLIRVFIDVNISILIVSISGIIMLLLFFSNSLISKINKTLFVFLISAFVAVTLGLLIKSGIDTLSVPNGKNITLGSFATALPIIFTSFGFQGSLHSLTKFVNNDRKIIKKACLFGSIIPAIVYILWICSTILIIYNNNPTFFARMVSESVDISEMISCLTHVADMQYLRGMFWIISLLALLTSIIGVGIAVFDDWSQKLTKAQSAVISVIPSALVAIFVPNAFIKILGLSGMILVVLAIFLPVFLYVKMEKRFANLKIDKTRSIGLIILTIVGGAIFGAGILELLWN